MTYYNVQDTADRIRQLRQRRGLSQEQAAQTLGMTGGSLSRVERGTRGCSVELLACMGDLYGVSMDYLILGRANGQGMDQGGLEDLIRYLMALREGLVRTIDDPLPRFPVPKVPKLEEGVC